MNESFENSAEKELSFEELQEKLGVILEEIRNAASRPGFEDIVEDKKEEAMLVFEKLMESAEDEGMAARQIDLPLQQ